MSFESGSIGFRAYYIQDRLPATVVQRFAADAAPPIDTLGTDQITGWVTSRHLLDRNIDIDTAHVAGYLRLTLMKAERKIPPALLRAQCRIEELAVMQAESKPFLKRHERSGIKKQITERMLPQMPPGLTGIPFVYDPSSGILYAGTMSDKQVDAFVIKFQQTSGVPPILVTAVTAAAKRKRLRTDRIEPTSFSPDLEDILAGGTIGQDFLTWLWFYSEARGGLMNVDGDDYGVAIEGPLTFVMEGDGAHVTQLRNGVPTVATEAKTSLLSGKKLKQARVTLSRHEETWTTMFEADGFVFRGLKVPKTEQLDSISMFQERVLSLNRFMNAFLTFFDRFLDERCDPAKWPEIQKDIHKWVSARAARR